MRAVHLHVLEYFLYQFDYNTIKNLGSRITMMVKQSLTISALAFATSLCLIPSLAAAKDIQNEQRNAYEARVLYNKNQSSHEGLLTRISQQEQRVADAQARLDQLITEETTSKENLAQSKTDLDAKVRSLNDVWDLRNQ